MGKYLVSQVNEDPEKARGAEGEVTQRYSEIDICGFLDSLIFWNVVEYCGYVVDMCGSL